MNLRKLQDRKERTGISIRDYINYYLAQGLNLIPVIVETKAPFVAWEKFQREKSSEEELKLIEAGLNVGIICGAISDNLAVIDFDKESIFEKVLGSGVCKDTIVVKTARGVHVYFKTDIPVSSFKLTELGVDVKGEGGYVIAPPSKHPSGKFYTLLSTFGIPIKRWEGDFKFEFLAKLKQHFDIPISLEEVNIKQILQGVETGGRNEAGIRLATWYRKQELSKEETFEKLRKWNKSNKPPLEECELKTIVESAFKPKEPYSYKFTESEFEEFSPEVVKKANKLLEKDGALLEFVTDASAEIIGEEEKRKFLFLLNLIAESLEMSGESATGKNALVEAVLKCFPLESWTKVTGLTDKSIRYLPESIQTLYLAERRAMKSKAEEESTAEYDLKLTISEGKLTVLVVARDPETGVFKTTKHETSVRNIITTSTEIELPPEFENRIWEMETLFELNEPVRNHILVQREVPNDQRVDTSEQKCVVRCAVKIIESEAPKKFIIPYATLLKELLNPQYARVRRDTEKLCKAIEASALTNFRVRPQYTDKAGNVHIVCLPQDFLYAWENGNEAIIGTFAGVSKRSKEIIKKCKEILSLGKLLTSESLAQTALLSADGARKWLNKFVEEGKLIKRSMKVNGRGRPINYYLDVFSEVKEVKIHLVDLFGKTENWVSEFEKIGIIHEKRFFRFLEPSSKTLLEKEVVAHIPVRIIRKIEELENAPSESVENAT